MAKRRLSNRDDFSPRIKLALAKRVGFRCSRCDAQTVGAKTGTDDEDFSVGKAAHIKAAAPGGPRYDPDQTPEERASIKNGIWACATCADIIDRDAAAYSVEQLLQMKANAEREARTRVGTVPVAPAFTRPTPTSIKRAIQIYCLDEAERQEQLDPRFSVAVNWSVDGPVYELRAREHVSARLIFDGENRQAAVAALRDVLDYGGSRSFENFNVRMEGSPLFADADGVVKRLQISTEARAITLTVALGEEPEVPVFVELSAEASLGQKGARIKGSTFGGLLSAELTRDHQTQTVNFNFHFDFGQWARKPLLHLPHFSKLMQVANTLKPGMGVNLHLTANGLESELGKGRLNSQEYPRHLRAFLHEVEYLRKLDTFFGLNVAMPADVDDVLRDAADGDELLALIDIHKAEKQEIKATLIPGEAVHELVKVIERQKPAPIQLTQPVNLGIFGNSYGPFEVAVSCPSAVIVPVGPANIAAGAPVQLILRAMDGYRWTAVYNKVATTALATEGVR